MLVVIEETIFEPPSLIELLEGAGVTLEGKEASKLEAMSDRSGNIDRMDFIVYAKKSAIFKMLLVTLFKALIGSKSASVNILTNIMSLSDPGYEKRVRELCEEEFEEICKVIICH